MTIETKYNIGDKVWTIVKNQVCELKIDTVSPYFNERLKAIQYSFVRNNYTHLFEFIEEEKLFSTKEELLKSL